MERRFDNVTSPVTAVIVMAGTEVVAFGILGAAVGIAQWIALRRHLARPGWWAVATTGGWTLAGMVGGVLAGTFGGALTGVGPDAGPIGVAVMAGGGIAAFLFLPGLLQWLALRGQVERAGWWVLGQAASFLVAGVVASPVVLVLARALGWSLPSAQAWGLLGALVGMLNGAITGSLLVRLLRRPIEGTARGGIS